MRDADVRAVVRRELNEVHGSDPHTRIVEEMGIWSGSVRIDMAVINGSLHGYELKSERDTLERLPAQAALYNQVFDRLTLVVAYRHAVKAKSTIPKWWGIVCVAHDGEGGLVLEKAREPSDNPAVDPLQLARLLWRSELLDVLKQYGIDRGVRTKPVEEMAYRMASELSAADVAASVRQTLKVRNGWLGQPVNHK